MKSVITSVFLFAFGSLMAQSSDSIPYNFGERYYNPKPCSGCPMVKPGEKFPESHPNARYLNDTTLWEWKEGPFPGTKVYGLKPQYLDTLIRNDGSVIEVPVWLKNPDWERIEAKPNL